MHSRATLLIAVFTAAICAQIAAAQNPSIPADWTFHSGQAGSQTGHSITGVGDINNDGFDDVIVAAALYDVVVGATTHTSAGKAWLFYGTASGLSSTPAWTIDGPTNNTNNSANLGFSGSVAGLGDINGDGFDDFAIGIPGYDVGTSSTNEGAVWVFFGGQSGPAATPDQILVGPAGSRLGCSIAGRGRVNNDNFADVVISGYSYANGESSEGGLWVYTGSATGLVTTPLWTAESNQANAQLGRTVAFVDWNKNGFTDVVAGAHLYDSNSFSNNGIVMLWATNASGINGGVPGTPQNAAWIAEGTSGNQYFGWSLANAGDVNGDTYEDLAIGAYGWSNPENREGGIFVYHGSPSGFTGGLNTVATSANFIGETDEADSFAGWAIAAGGDVDGDGYDDVILSGYGWDGPLAANFTGVAIIWRGSALGVNGGQPGNPTNAWRVIDGPGGGAYFGWHSAVIGDVNNDGIDDYAVGANRWASDTVNLAQEGAAYVWYGFAPIGVSFSQAAVSVSEGAGSVALTVNLSDPQSSPVNVPWSTADGTASAGSDYVAGSGTLTFPANVTSQTITITILQDTLSEANETFTVTLAPTAMGLVAQPNPTVTVTINDDDPLPVLQLPTASMSLSEDAGTGSVPVLLAGPSGQTVTVQYSFVDGPAVADPLRTANNPADYTGVAGTLTFTPGGSATQFIPYEIINDLLHERDEVFQIVLSSPVGAQLSGVSTIQVTILDDDPAPSVSLGAATGQVNEAAGQLTIGLSINNAAGTPVSVSVRTVDGTATSPADYTGIDQLVTFEAGQTTRSVTVTIINDSLSEGPETFTVELYGYDRTQAGAVTVTTVTIVDDDAIAPAFMSNAPTSATIGTALQHAVEVTALPVASLSLIGAPAWINLGSTSVSGSGPFTATAQLTGTPGPTNIGPVSFTIRADNGFGSPVDQVVQLTVAAPVGGIEDVDLNGNVNVVDVQLTVNIVLSSSQPAFTGQGDVNGDGTVNVIDVQMIVNKILTGN